MADKTLNSDSGEEIAGAETDYIAALNEMKANSVSKEDYLKLKADNKRLLDTLVQGGSLSPDEVPQPVDVDALRKELFTTECDLNNLDYITKSLQLRDAIIEKGGIDPFLPYGKHIAPTDEDISTANRVADILKECVDYAEGDSSVFTNELQRRMIDSAPSRRGR